MMIAVSLVTEINGIRILAFLFFFLLVFFSPSCFLVLLVPASESML
jgi:hypothetical protein